MDADILTLCAELERLFELNELSDLARDALGLDPASIPGGTTKSAFARGLTQRCMESDALVALCDSVAAMRSDLDPRVDALRTRGDGGEKELELGDTFGPYLILRRLGRGRAGTVYLARADGADVRLKVLHRSAAYDRVSLQRFLAASRLAGAVDHPALPGPVTAGEVGGRYFVAHAHLEGQTLASRIGKTHAMHIEEARAVLEGILSAISALHEARLVHGSLRPENVLVGSNADGTDRVFLLDAGTYHLAAVPPLAGGRSDRLAAFGSPRTLSPEQIEGRLPDARSDLYSFGAIVFEVLTGKPMFVSSTSAEAFLAHLTREAPAPGNHAPAGWVGPDVDGFVKDLLEKRPERRPAAALPLLSQLATLGSAGAHGDATIEEEELEDLIRELLANPSSALSEEALMAALREGADPERVAASLRLAADLVDPESSPLELRTHLRLLGRAARLYATSLKDPESAEPLYARLVEVDPEDAEAVAALERLRRLLGKHEDIVEDLLARCEGEEDPEKRAALWAQIGKLYDTELNDPEQALVAYTEAFTADPTSVGYAAEVDRLATKKPASWGDVMQSCMEAARGDLERLARHALLLQMAHWYDARIARPDLALPCYTGVLADDATHQEALDGVTGIYRKAQQWAELGQTLMLQADSPSMQGPRARDLRAEAAEILETRLGATAAAQQLYERVLAEDPAHEKACDALVRLYEAAGDFSRFVAALESRARALGGEERVQALFRVAEATELQVKDAPDAIRRYQLVITEDPKHLDALRGLDRCYSQTGQFRELIGNLQMQVAVAATPRQKVLLWERVAAIWDEEFLDHTNAAAAWENVLDLDAEHDDALSNLARHYRALERWNDVVLVGERHLELLDKDKPRKIEKALALGRALANGLKVPERAIGIYEIVLDLDPGNSEALEALAQLRAGTGETDAAVAAMETLAENASTPAERAERYIRAAQLLEERGDPDGAIERYKLAADANPKDRAASMILRAAYVARGDVRAAADLLEQEIKQTEGEAARAKLAGEMAALCRDRLRNDARAESWAKVALDQDPTNLDALRVIGDIAFDAERFVEAARCYEQVANRTEALTATDVPRVLEAYAASLLKLGNPEKALEVSDRLLQVAPDDLGVLRRVAARFFEHGAEQRSFDLHWELLHRTKSEVSDEERAVILYRLGESARRAGDLKAAMAPLEEAVALDPTGVLALKSLALVQGAREDWEGAIRTMYRQLESEVGDDRVKLLLDIGDLASEKLKDPSYAAKSYLTALGEQPSDRRILTKLMQLYSAEKDWDRLVQVVLKLADFVDDNKQKAKYLHTAGRIAWKELGDARMGSQILARALEADSENDAVAKDGVEVHSLAGNADALKEALKRQVKIASDAGHTEQMVRSLTSLAELYLHHFRRMDQAIAVYEAAEEVDPTNVPRQEILASLYAAAPGQYLEKALLSQSAIIGRDPFRPDAHRTLRRLHTEAKRADAAWCACQALYVLGQADPDEERFYLRMRTEEGISAKARLTEPDFHAFVVHRHTNPLVTALFTVIQPAVMQARVKTLKQLGYGPELLIDPARGQFASAQVIPYVAEILGQACPPMFENPNEYGDLGFIHAQHPSIVVGTAVIGVALPIQTIAFMAARHLSYYRQGLYVRQLVPTTTGLKAWLFAAIRLMVPAFPVPPDLAGPVQEAHTALERVVTGPPRDHLARVVSKLVAESSALDLKKWTAGVDLTADRAGLLMGDDLATALEVIRAADPASSSVPQAERVEEIYKYAVSEQYFAARQLLGIAVGG